MHVTDKMLAHPAVELREEPDGRAVLLHRESAASVAINPVGAAVWKRLDGRRYVAEIAAEIRDHFSGVPGTAPEEIGVFVDELAELGFVERKSQGMTGQAEKDDAITMPHAAHVMITARCNQRCRYCCFFDDPHVTYHDLPTQEWLRFFEELGRCGVTVLMMSGGEPFIREDLPQLLDGIVEHGMRFFIGSNGGLIDDRIAARIAATGRCGHVLISVDGSHTETHDSFRGQGSFEGAIRGIRTLQRHGVHTVAQMVLHRQNVHDLEATAHLLLEELGLPLTFMSPAQAYGRCRFFQKEVLLTTAQREAVMERLSRLCEKYGERTSPNSKPLVDLLRWRRMEEARQQHLPAFPDGGRLTHCHCMDDKITVLSDGTMVPCFRLTHLPLGRINREMAADVWLHGPVRKLMRQRREIPLVDFALCDGCDYVVFCTGSCPASAYTETGQMDHPDPIGCLRLYLADGGRLP